ncbi:MAG: hypothetical protein HQL03_02540 [Nitrospirae bacterium]|nr:hypothetical protein [Nitrospirota bacterium]MBF0593029.1 hypothetical protein [Nitrospirota bacterium]
MRRYVTSTQVEQERAVELVNIRQYITDNEGHIAAVIVDIEELRRVEELIKDLSDLAVIKERRNEQS